MVSHVMSLTPLTKLGEQKPAFERRAIFVLNPDKLIFYHSSEFAFGSLRDGWIMIYFILYSFFKGRGGYTKVSKLNLQQKANILKGFVQTSYYCLIHFFKRVCLTNLLTHACL